MDSSIAKATERALRAARSELIPDELADEFVLPAYDGHSLANVPATISTMLGRAPVGGLPPLDEIYWRERFGRVDHVVLFLVDALGYLQLGERLAAEPESILSRMARAGHLLPMTSVCPSTTATALVTLGTAEPPCAHGMLGYELWLREYGVLIEMLGLKPVFGQGTTQLLDWGYVPETFVPVPGLGSLLSARGIATSAHLAQQFIDGALTRACYRGYGQLYGHAGLESLFDNLAADLAQAGSAPSFHYAYWGGVDKAIHLHGADTNDWREATAQVATALGDWFAGWRAHAVPNTLFVVCADHGFVSTPEADAYRVEGSPLADLCAIPYSGESRFAYLHLLQGATPAAQAALAEALGKDYVVVESAAALQAGLFGPAGAAYAETPARLGNYVAIARGRHYLDRQGRAAWMRGRHGGLSPEEMLVPWLAVRADALD